MEKLTMVGDALKELGEASAQDLAALIEKKHGVTIPPKYIPIYKASVRDRQMRVGRAVGLPDNKTG
jgi:hypothetical protein